MKVVTFGEILLRLSSQNYKKLFQNDIFEASFCGAETNVAVSLSNFGIESAYVSKVPDSDIGQAAINSLRYFGVDTNYVCRGGDRLGLYYLEKGASQRPSKIIYDRAHSAIAEASKSDFNWDEIFTECGWFHFSGINPAISENLAEICFDACRIAKEKNITVSCDINYRSKLWSTEEAKLVMTKLMKYVDVCIGNEEDAEKVFGIVANNADVSNGKLEHESYKEVAKKICDRFACKYVAITLRTSISATNNKWAGMIYSRETNDYFLSKEYYIHIVDRVGSGDSFAAGVIFGLIKDMNFQDCIEFAVAASCLKHTQEGDFNRISICDVKNLMNGDESGRIKR